MAHWCSQCCLQHSPLFSYFIIIVHTGIKIHRVTLLFLSLKICVISNKMAPPNDYLKGGAGRRLWSLEQNLLGYVIEWNLCPLLHLHAKVVFPGWIFACHAAVKWLWMFARLKKKLAKVGTSEQLVDDKEGGYCTFSTGSHSAWAIFSYFNFFLLFWMILLDSLI